MAPKHPAPFSDALLPIFADVLADYMPKHRDGSTILDPFAGVGRVHELRTLMRNISTVGVEIEPEWANEYPSAWEGWQHVGGGTTLIGDATTMAEDHGAWVRHFDAVVTSPCYGNRMADHHENHDKCSECGGTGIDPMATTALIRAGLARRCRKCKGSGLSPRRSYRHDLGRMPSTGSAATMQWGPEYRELHEIVWRQVHTVLRARGVFVLNIKDHVRDKQRVRVSAWHRRTVEAIGFERLETISIPLPGMRYGRNHAARIPNEYVYVFRKVSR